MKYLFFKNDPLIEKCFFNPAQKDILGVNYSDLFSNDLNYDIYTQITKFIDNYEVDTLFLFRKYVSNYDELEALKLNLDFLGVNIFEYYINKWKIENLVNAIQDDIDFADATNILIVSDMLVGNNLQVASNLLERTYNTYKPFFENE